MKRFILGLLVLVAPASHAQTSVDSTAAVAPPSSEAPAKITTKLAWTAKFPDGDVEWVRATMSGVVVAGTEEGLFGLDDTSGKILWKKADLHEPDNIAVDVLAAEPYALLRLEKGQRGKVVRILLDVTTGREVWNSADLGFVDVWHQVLTPRGLLVMSGKLASGDPDKVIMAVRLETGERAWLLAVDKKQAEHALADGPVLLDTDSTMVTSGERMNRYDLRTGKRMWQSPKFEAATPKRCSFLGAEPEADKSRSLPPIARPRVARDGHALFVAYASGICAYDAQKGVPLWKEPTGLCGQCVHIRETDYGLLVHTKHWTKNDEVLLISPATGSVLWQYPSDSAIQNQGSFKKNLSMINKVFESGALVGELALSNPILIDRKSYILSGSSIRQEIQEIDMSSGASKTLTKVEQSADYEPAVQLVSTPAGLLVIGLQDLQWYDMTGKSTRRQQYEAPDDFGLGLLMLGGIALGRSLGTIDFAGGELELGGRYEPALDRMMRDYHATSALGDVVFMLSGRDPEVNGIALLGIDRGTGSIVTRIPASKKPRFVADVMNGHVFMMSDDAIQCYACSR